MYTLAIIVWALMIISPIFVGLQEMIRGYNLEEPESVKISDDEIEKILEEIS